MKARLTAARDVGKPTRIRTDKKKEYRKQYKRRRNTNVGRKDRKDNFCRRLVINKVRLLEEPGLVTLRDFMQHVGQTGPGMRLLHRYRSGDVWNDFGNFMRAYEAIDISSPLEVEIMEHNYNLHLARIRRHDCPGGRDAAPSGRRAEEGPEGAFDYLTSPVPSRQEDDSAESNSRCAEFDETQIDWADELDDSEPPFLDIVLGGRWESSAEIRAAGGTATSDGLGAHHFTPAAKMDIDSIAMPPPTASTREKHSQPG